MIFDVITPNYKGFFIIMWWNGVNFKWKYHSLTLYSCTENCGNTLPPHTSYVFPSYPSDQTDWDYSDCSYHPDSVWVPWAVWVSVSAEVLVGLGTSWTWRNKCELGEVIHHIIIVSERSVFGEVIERAVSHSWIWHWIWSTSWISVSNRGHD